MVLNKKFAFFFAYSCFLSTFAATLDAFGLIWHRERVHAASSPRPHTEALEQREQRQVHLHSAESQQWWNNVQWGGIESRYILKGVTCDALFLTLEDLAVL